MITSCRFVQRFVPAVSGIYGSLFPKLRVEPTSGRSDWELRLALIHWHGRAPNQAHSPRFGFLEKGKVRLLGAFLVIGFGFRLSVEVEVCFDQ